MNRSFSDASPPGRCSSHFDPDRLVQAHVQDEKGLLQSRNGVAYALRTRVIDELLLDNEPAASLLAALLQESQRSNIAWSPS